MFCCSQLVKSVPLATCTAGCMFWPVQQMNDESNYAALFSNLNATDLVS
jgi:hypothetical protein